MFERVPDLSTFHRVSAPTFQENETWGTPRYFCRPIFIPCWYNQPTQYATDKTIRRTRTPRKICKCGVQEESLAGFGMKINRNTQVATDAQLKTRIRQTIFLTFGHCLFALLVEGIRNSNKGNFRTKVRPKESRTTNV